MAPASFKRDRNVVAGYAVLSESPISTVARLYSEAQSEA
jgi:hypothetical protein